MICLCQKVVHHSDKCDSDLIDVFQRLSPEDQQINSAIQTYLLTPGENMDCCLGTGVSWRACYLRPKAVFGFGAGCSNKKHRISMDPLQKSISDEDLVCLNKALEEIQELRDVKCAMFKLYQKTCSDTKRDERSTKLISLDEEIQKASSDLKLLVQEISLRIIGKERVFS